MRICESCNSRDTALHQVVALKDLSEVAGRISGLAFEEGKEDAARDRQTLRTFLFGQTRLPHVLP